MRSLLVCFGVVSFVFSLTLLVLPHSGLHLVSISPLGPVSCKLNLSSVMSLSKLPPEVYSAMLNKSGLPLPQRLRLRALSSRVSNCIEAGLEKETSLVVRDSLCDYLARQPDDLILRFGTLTEELIALLCQLFPATSQLTFAFGSLERPSARTSWNALPSLLKQMGTNLTTVHLYGCCHAGMDVWTLAESLNALLSLTWLTINVNETETDTSCGNFNERLLRLIGPTLSRLVKLVLPGPVERGWHNLFWPLSPRCTHLLLSTKDFTGIPQQNTQNLTHLHLVYVWNSAWECITPLQQLNSLTLHFGQLTILNSDLLGHLSGFSHLTDVTLLKLRYQALPELPSSKAPLSTLKRLTLQMDYWHPGTHFGHFFTGIRIWCPHLAQFTLITDRQYHDLVRASCVQLPFVVKIREHDSVNFQKPNW